MLSRSPRPFSRSLYPDSVDPRTLKRLRREVHRLQGAFDLLPDAVFLVDRVSLAIVDANQVACDSLGYRRWQLLTLRLPELIPAASQARLTPQLEEIIAGGADGSVLQTVHRSNAGAESPVQWLVRIPPRANDRQLLIVARPLLVTATERASTWHEFPLDPLTSLPGRAAFDRRLATALCQAQHRADYRFAVFFIDLDRFKLVNDSFGHLCGDRLLQEVARRLVAQVRPGDMVARWGGDEFTLLVDHLHDDRDAVCVAERILAQLNSPVDCDGHQLLITASIGIAISSPRYRVPEALLHDADRAMYQAKAAGRAAYALFDESTCPSLKHGTTESEPADGDTSG